MNTRTVPFHMGIFWHAMINLLGREPDSNFLGGFDGFYTIRYDPKSEEEEKKFAEASVILQDWLSIFELIPVKSRCEYGRLLNPQKGEENKDYLYIHIVHPVEKKETTK